MWHSASCWHLWQECLAEWGWETVAYSLPGHGESPARRSLRWSTLGYYLNFLVFEAARLHHKPAVIGHSMGGALVQWYLKHIGDLPAAVLVAPWPAYSSFPGAFRRFFQLDFVGSLLSNLTLSANPWIRTPDRAARALVTDKAVVSPEELHRQLGPESLFPLPQHNPPFWRPPEHVNTPMLWLAAAEDAFSDEDSGRRSAEHYGAEYILVEDAGHDLMLEHNYRETARTVHHWLLQQNLE